MLLLTIDLEIKPGVGAGRIELGTTKATVRQLLAELGYPLLDSNGELDYFCGNSLQLEYENELVRFIGISDHEEIYCTYIGTDVFDTSAEELFHLMASHEPELTENKPGDTCYFPIQGLNLWEADEQYDRKGKYKRAVYAQIGVELPSA